MNFELLSYLLKASLVMAILTGAYAWLVKRETFLQVNRWLLWLNVAATLVLPIVPVPDWEWVPDTPAQIVNQAASWTKEKAPKQPFATTQASSPRTAATIVKEESLSKAVSTVASPQKTWTLFSWIALVYWLGVGILGAKFLVQLASLWRLKQKSTLYATDFNVVLVENPTLTAPFSFFHWIFYNPHQHTTDEWEQVWTHECIHAQQYHSLDMLSSELLKCVFWFNPFAWWHQRLVQETLEYITDRAVLETGVEKKSYQFHLLRSTLNTSQQTFANHFNQALLKSRIAMMNKRKSSWKAFGKYGLFIASIWVSAAFTKPYREEVVTQIITNLPQLSTLVPLLKDDKKGKPTAKTVEVDLDEIRVYQTMTKTTTQETENDLKLTNKKYVRYSEKNEIQVLITSKTTLSDMVEIQQEFKQLGKDLKIIQWITDSSGRFLRKLSVEVTPFAGKMPTLISQGTDTTFMPMKPIQLTVPIANFGNKWGYGDCCIDPTQQALSREEDDIAKFEALEINTKPDVIARFKRKGDYFKPTHIFLPQSLYYEGSMTAYQAITTTKNTDRITLSVKEPYRSAQFRLNGKKVGIEQIEKLSPERFLRAEKYEVTDAFGKTNDTYFVIYAKL